MPENGHLDLCVLCFVSVVVLCFSFVAQRGGGERKILLLLLLRNVGRPDPDLVSVHVASNEKFYLNLNNYHHQNILLETAQSSFVSD